MYVQVIVTKSIFNTLKIKRTFYEKSLALPIQHRDKKL